eukprot:TRINITY_DN8125_c0_g1_i1.p1 TRINITY_DN8125_c0_g1~~TRINITY_DN8125_c0_g1_i1.p1  ORF type:complete len:240 (+),score=36.71 TRINITY_DN8125_c0_g1_i1:166-885(+)
MLRSLVGSEMCIRDSVERGYRVFGLDLVHGANPRVEYILTDVRFPDQIESSVHQVMEQCGRLDVAVCNAGIHLSATVEDTSEEQFDRIMMINVKGAFFLAKAAVRAMNKTQLPVGGIVLIGSDQCLVGKPRSVAYGATKGALAQMTKGLALDCAPLGIRVNCACVGTVDTPLYRNAVRAYCEQSGASEAEVHEEEACLQPLGRIGTPTEVANLVCFLASDQASFMTGSLVACDGGYTAK